MKPGNQIIFFMVIVLSVSYVHGFSLIPSVSSLIPSFSIGNLFGGKSLLGGAFTEYWNKIKYCVMSSKISYSCVIPNIKFFIYTQLTGFPIPFIGPTLSTINMAYLGVNYLPFVLRDVICIVKSVALGALIPSIPIPSLPIPGLPNWLPSFGIPKIPFLIYLNQTLGDEVYLNNTMLVENYDNFNLYF